MGETKLNKTEVSYVICSDPNGHDSENFLAVLGFFPFFSAIECSPIR